MQGGRRKSDGGSPAWRRRGPVAGAGRKQLVVRFAIVTHRKHGRQAVGPRDSLVAPLQHVSQHLPEGGRGTHAGRNQG
jgi:hypothetical protein